MTFPFCHLTFIACLISLPITAQNIGWSFSCNVACNAEKINPRNSSDNGHPCDGHPIKNIAIIFSPNLILKVIYESRLLQ